MSAHSVFTKINWVFTPDILPRCSFGNSDKDIRFQDEEKCTVWWKANSDVELEATKRKLAAMEKLNRALQAERTQLLEKAKGPQDKAKNGTPKD